MKIPYVIDNQKFHLTDVLNALLNVHKEMSLDVATAYFSISGFRLLQAQLESLRSFRLLLGFQPSEAKDVGLRPSPAALKKALRGDLEDRGFRVVAIRLDRPLPEQVTALAGVFAVAP